MPYGAHETMETNEILLEKINMITHFNLYARETNNPQLQDMLSRHLEEETQSYNELVRYTHDYTAFSPVPPNTEISGVSPQSIQYGLNNPPPLAPQSDAKISDQEIAIAMLCCHKNAARNAIWASLECADPNLRQLLMNSSANCVRQAYEVFLFMNEQGLYQVPTLKDHTAKEFLHRYQPTDGNGQYAGQSAVNSDYAGNNMGYAGQFGQQNAGMGGQYGQQNFGMAGGQYGQRNGSFGGQFAQQGGGFGQQNAGYGAQFGQQNAGYGAQRGAGAQFGQRNMNYAAQFGQPTVGFGGPYGQTSRPYPGQFGQQSSGFAGQFGQQAGGFAGQFGQQGAGYPGQFSQQGTGYTGQFGQQNAGQQNAGQQNAGRSIGVQSPYGTQSFANGNATGARGNAASGGSYTNTENSGIYNDTTSAGNSQGLGASSSTASESNGSASSAQNWRDDAANTGSSESNGAALPQ